jgi:hypothetical protein
MRRFLINESLGESLPSGRLELGGDFSLQKFNLRLQVKPEIASPSLEGQALMLAGAGQDHTRRTQRRVLPHQVI